MWSDGDSGLCADPMELSVTDMTGNAVTTQSLLSESLEYFGEARAPAQASPKADQNGSMSVPSATSKPRGWGGLTAWNWVVVVAVLGLVIALFATGLFLLLGQQLFRLRRRVEDLATRNPVSKPILRSIFQERFQDMMQFMTKPPASSSLPDSMMKETSKQRKKSKKKHKKRDPSRQAQ